MRDLLWAIIDSLWRATFSLPVLFIPAYFFAALGPSGWVRALPAIVQRHYAKHPVKTLLAILWTIVFGINFGFHLHHWLREVILR